MTDDWRDVVKGRTTTAADAIARISPRSRVFVGSGAGEPRHLLRALTRRLPDLDQIEIIQPYTLESGVFATLGFEEGVRPNAFIVSDAMRQAVEDGRADYTPALPSRAPELLRSRKLPIDVTLFTVSPPDEHGYCSLGVAVDVTRVAVETAHLVIAQVNSSMPRTYGATPVSAREIDLFVEHREPLLTAPRVQVDETIRAIAGYIRRLVPDAATLQVGAGILTDTVLKELGDKHDLGIHTELFTDGMMRLAKSGVINGSKKTVNPLRMVAVTAVGSRSLYRWLHENPAVEFYPSDYVNSPMLIARNHRMVAVNFGEAIDLMGQVSTGAYGPDYLTSPPGRADFMRGAAQAVDGKPILALPSTADTEDGTMSRIVPTLIEGAEMLLTPSDVHYVVTEHGIAYLHGKTIRERAMALISVAHPDHRGELLHAAKHRHIVPINEEVPPRGDAYPRELERWVELKDGTQVLLRPLRPEDSELMKDLFHSFSEKTRYLRFHTLVKEMPQRGRQAFFNVDYQQELALAAARQDGDMEEFLGTGRFVLDEGTRSAEVAFVVRDDWQGKGLGSKIFNALAEIALARGISKLTAEILAENRAMLRVIDRSGYAMETKREAGVVHVEIDLAEDEG